MPLEDTYTYFYLLKIDDDVTGEAILAQVLQHMQLPFNLVAKSPAECSLVVDPAEYSIAFKLGPPVVVKPGDRAIQELISPYLDKKLLQDQHSTPKGVDDQAADSCDFERILSPETAFDGEKENNNQYNSHNYDMPLQISNYRTHGRDLVLIRNELSLLSQIKAHGDGQVPTYKTEDSRPESVDGWPRLYLISTRSHSSGTY